MPTQGLKSGQDRKQVKRSVYVPKDETVLSKVSFAPELAKRGLVQIRWRRSFRMQVEIILCEPGNIRARRLATAIDFAVSPHHIARSRSPALLNSGLQPETCSLPAKQRPGPHFLRALQEISI
jgi:hypothetical protein